MSDANGPTVVVVTSGEGEAGEGSEGGEIQAVAEAEATEEVADAAVEIARIEADRDVTLAAISAETTEAIHESFSNQELEQCRLRIAELEGENTALRTQLESQPALLIPVQSEEPPPNPPLELESAKEDGPRESQEAPAQAAEPPSQKRKPLRWI